MRKRRVAFSLCCGLLVWCLGARLLLAQDPGADAQREGAGHMDLREMANAAGTIGAVIAAMSVAMVALIIEHQITIRHNTLIPPGLAESVHQHVAQKLYAEARQQCKLQPSFLAHVLAAGLDEIDLGYETMEKSMEDASAQQAARLFRKIEYLSVIGTLAPMLGLLGTVWGMILAFMEFETKANPQVSELAPGIYHALVTTLMGLGVAVPALASLAIFRNRVDELVAEASLVAERVFADFRRSATPQGGSHIDPHRAEKRRAESAKSAPLQRIPSVTMDKET